MKQNYSNIQELCMIGLATAIICIIAPLSIPMPLSVPMTLQTFIITLVTMILGAKRGTTATFIYIVLGSFGLPIFSNFTGGWQILIGPTGGFILSFPLMAYIIGHSPNILGLIGAQICNFVCGIVMFCIITKSSLFVGLTTCVVPFIPITIIKAYLAYLVGTKIRKRINIFGIVD